MKKRAPTVGPTSALLPIARPRVAQLLSHRCWPNCLRTALLPTGAGPPSLAHRPPFAHRCWPTVARAGRAGRLVLSTDHVFFCSSEGSHRLRGASEASQGSMTFDNLLADRVMLLEQVDLILLSRIGLDT